MCGILGYFRKTPGSDDQLGATMLSMLEALGRRGPDSAGVALVGPVHRASYIVRIQAGDELDLSQQAIAENREAIETFARTLDNVSDVSSSGVYVRFLLAGDIDLAALTDRIESRTSFEPSNPTTRTRGSAAAFLAVPALSSPPATASAINGRK